MVAMEWLYIPLNLISGGSFGLGGSGQGKGQLLVAACSQVPKCHHERVDEHLSHNQNLGK